MIDNTNTAMIVLAFVLLANSGVRAVLVSDRDRHIINRNIWLAVIIILVGLGS